MSTSVYQFASTMTPQFATEVLPTSLPFLGFQCGECPRQFARRYALREHLATHSGEKNYVCPAPNCKKRFTTTSNLARHRRLHGEELQPLACPACAKTFSTSHKLQRHLRVHKDSPTRRCKFADCDKTFSSMGNLNRHMRNQHMRFGHPLASEAKREEQSPTSVDAKEFVWGADARDALVTPIGEDLELDASGEHDVSDEELLEVLAWLLDDEAISSEETEETSTIQ